MIKRRSPPIGADVICVNQIHRRSHQPWRSAAIWTGLPAVYFYSTTAILWEDKLPFESQLAQNLFQAIPLNWTGLRFLAVEARFLVISAVAAVLVASIGRLLAEDGQSTCEFRRRPVATPLALGLAWGFLQAVYLELAVICNACFETRIHTPSAVVLGVAVAFVCAAIMGLSNRQPPASSSETANEGAAMTGWADSVIDLVWIVLSCNIFWAVWTTVIIRGLAMEILSSGPSTGNFNGVPINYIIVLFGVAFSGVKAAEFLFGALPKEVLKLRGRSSADSLAAAAFGSVLTMVCVVVLICAILSLTPWIGPMLACLGFSSVFALLTLTLTLVFQLLV